METRRFTRTLLEMVDEGLLDAKQVLRDALNYMSEADVAEFADVNGYLEEEEVDEDLDEDDGQPTEMEEWLDFDPDC